MANSIQIESPASSVRSTRASSLCKKSTRASERSLAKTYCLTSREPRSLARSWGRLCRSRTDSTAMRFCLERPFLGFLKPICPFAGGSPEGRSPPRRDGALSGGISAARTLVCAGASALCRSRRCSKRCPGTPAWPSHCSETSTNGGRGARASRSSGAVFRPISARRAPSPRFQRTGRGWRWIASSFILNRAEYVGGRRPIPPRESPATTCRSWRNSRTQ